MRELSGIYIKEGKDNICFEDLDPKRQIEILSNSSKNFVIIMALKMSSVVKKLGDDFDIRVLPNNSENGD